MTYLIFGSSIETNYRCNLKVEHKITNNIGNWLVLGWFCFKPNDTLTSRQNLKIIYLIAVSINVHRQLSEYKNWEQNSPNISNNSTTVHHTAFSWWKECSNSSEWIQVNCKIDPRVRSHHVQCGSVEPMHLQEIHLIFQKETKEKRNLKTFYHRRHSFLH